MPSLPPFPFKSAPDGEFPHLPAPVIVSQPVINISYPAGCSGSFAVLQFEQMPIFDREPDTVPNQPGGGYSYMRFIEYLDMGISPHATSLWSGTGAEVWTVYCDGVVVSQSGSPLTFTAIDGLTEPFGIQVPNTLMGGGTIDWTIPHDWHIEATYLDRPSYEEYYIDSASVGVVCFGPSTGPDDPRVPYIIEGTAFGCDERNEAFFPSALFGNESYWDPWVDTHHSVADVNGPTDRHGNYLPLTGPWGSDVPKQALCSPPGSVPCTGASQGGGYLPDQPGGAGDVYATSLEDFVQTVVYAAVTYAVATTPQTLPSCGSITATPVFDVTRAHKALPA